MAEKYKNNFLNNKKIFPIVDISYVLNDKNKLCIQEDEIVLTLANEVLQAFEQWGFVYLKGHNDELLSQDYINEVFMKLRQYFFQLPVEEKEKLFMNSDDTEEVMGYTPFESERLNSSQPGDLKEALEYKPYMADQYKINPRLLEKFDLLFSVCKKLTYVMLRLLSIALDLSDQDTLLNFHQRIGETGNVTILRTLYYPPVDECNVKNLQTRCGEHTDYGTMTLLFQDTADGLEVINRRILNYI